MSAEQKITIEFWSKTFMRISIGLIAFMGSFAFVKIHQNIEKSADDIVNIKERLARIEAIFFP